MLLMFVPTNYQREDLIVSQSLELGMLNGCSFCCTLKPEIHTSAFWSLVNGQHFLFLFMSILMKENNLSNSYFIPRLNCFETWCFLFQNVGIDKGDIPDLTKVNVFIVPLLKQSK